MRLRPLFLLLSSVAPVAAGAQGAVPARDPAQVAAAFFEAVAAERWRDAAGYLDLEAFDGYRQQQISSIRATLPPPPVRAEDLMQHEPDMPREAAEYQARRMNKAFGRFGERTMREFGVTRLDSLAALTPVDAAARWLEARDPRAKTRRALEEARAKSNCPRSIGADRDLIRQSPPAVVGAVVLDSVAYVLFRDPSRFAGAAGADSSEPRRGRGGARPPRSWDDPPPAMLQLRRVAGEWRIFGGLERLGAGSVGIMMVCEPQRPGGG